MSCTADSSIGAYRCRGHRVDGKLTFIKRTGSPRPGG